MEYLKKILKKLNPSPAIAGLEISDFYLRFFYGGGPVINFEVRLNPGIVKEGKILDVPKFKDALTKIKVKLGSNFKRISHLIIALPSSNVYLQAFSLPYLEGEKLAEAARLNLQMVSPLPAEETYADWDLLEESVSGELRIAGAFTEKSNVVNIIRICKELGFIVLAIEPSIQSVERAVHHVISKEKEPAPYLILNVSSEGMDFAGIKNHRVYFDYFISWFSMYSGASEIAPQIFEDTLNKYIQQVLNFAASNWNFEVKELMLGATELGDRIKEIIEKDFRLRVIPVDLKGYAPGAAWGVALGAYLRGLLPRSEDKLISLTGVDTEDEYKQSQTLLFSELWRNMVVTFGITLLIIFAGSYGLLGRVAQSSLMQNAKGLSPEETSELANIKARAEMFNKLIATIMEIKGMRHELNSYFTALQKAMNNKISLTRITFQSFGTPIIISGSAADDSALANFKRSLESSKEFSDISLPLNSVVSSGGRVSFSLTLNFVPL